MPQFHRENCLVSVTLYLALANDSTHFRHSKNNKQAKQGRNAIIDTSQLLNDF